LQFDCATNRVAANAPERSLRHAPNAIFIWTIHICELHDGSSSSAKESGII